MCGSTKNEEERGTGILSVRQRDILG